MEEMGKRQGQGDCDIEQRREVGEREKEDAYHHVNNDFHGFTS